MKHRYRGTTILIPAMDETYSLVQTVDTIVETVNSADIAEIILLLCERTTEVTRNTAEKLVKKYGNAGSTTTLSAMMRIITSEVDTLRKILQSGF